MYKPERGLNPRKDFIPIENLSAEHIDPAYDMPVPKTPEEIALGIESEAEEKWNEWLTQQFGEGDWEEYGFDEFDGEYWDRVEKIAEKYEELSDDDDDDSDQEEKDFKDFVERYDLPETATRGQIEQLIARARKYQRSRHSWEAQIDKVKSRLKRGKGDKPERKDHKGQESIRRAEDESVH